nr:putative ribonuclease H-like domain-containing protein [Tanacetum cinerariifolium]
MKPVEGLVNRTNRLDSYEVPANAATTDTSSDGTGKKKGRTVTLTANDMQKRKNDVKARTSLLRSLPDAHQLRFCKYKTAQELWAAILKTFSGNEATKKTKKNLLKQQYGNFKAEGSETLEKTFNRLQVIVSQLSFMDVKIEQDDLNQKFLTSLAPEWLMHMIVWRNRSDLDTMILDDLSNHLKVYESEVQKKSKPNSQNMAFISSAKHNRGNEEVNTISVSTTSANIEVASISQDTAYAYISFQSSGSQIKFEDINQIDEDDMEDMDIKCNMALLSMRANRAPRSQDKRRRDNYRQGSKVEEQAPKELMEIDGVGWDWSYMANDKENHALIAGEETPIEFALMAKTSAESEVFDNSPCSKACKKNSDSLNSKITELTNKLYDAKNMIYHYKLALAQVEARLAELRNQKLKYCEKIRVLEFKTESSTDCIENLKEELELIKKEKEGLDSKLAGFQTASKDLDSLLESQRLDKNKEGLGYSVVPLPPAQVYSPPKKDLSWTGLPEFKDDIITDYSRPSPAIESNISYLSDYEPFNRGYVSFGQGGCKITGKGTIKTGKLEFENVYFVKVLKYNLFSVSQIYDNKNSVMFTDSECIVLGRDFKLLDDANVLLWTPRQHNMYSINLNNIIPHKDLTCLVVKAYAYEGMLCHRRLGHLNFKTINSKAFRVFNKRTKRIEESLHVEFIENKAIEKGAGPNWLFDIDSLTKSINYVPVVAVHDALLESSLSKPQDDCSIDVPESSGNSNPTATSTNPSPDHMKILTVETSIPTVSSPVPMLALLTLKNLQKTDPALLQFCLFSCFLSQVEPKKISHALQDPSWVEAMQEELLQFKIQNIWTLVDCPKGVRPIGIKWVFKNKKDERGIVIRNKARLVTQGHTQEERIDYDEVFTPVAKIKAIRLFLAYASFMGFTIYQMDVKSAFLYDVSSAKTPMDKEKPWGKDGTGKDVDLYLYRSMIGSLMYLAASRPDIMFAVCACSRHQVTCKECHLHAVKRIFRYLKAHPKLGLWYPKESPFDLVAYLDSDYGGAT